MGTHKIPMGSKIPMYRVRKMFAEGLMEIQLSLRSLSIIMVTIMGYRHELCID